MRIEQVRSEGDNVRILVFGLSSVHGGVESVILSFCRRALEKQICEFDFIVIDKIPRFATFLRDEYACNFVIVPNRLQHPIAYRQALKLTLVNGDYDFVWFNACTLSDITLLAIARNYGAKCILHSHNSKNMGNVLNKILHIIHKIGINNYVDVYCACSDEAASFMFPRSIYSDSNKWQFVKNGIAVQDFRYNPEKRNRIRSEHGFKDCVLVGHVGRFHPQKNHKLVLSIFEKFHDKYPFSRLLLFGEGFLEEELKRTVHQLQLDGSVFFMGARENINDWLSALDVFLFPSLYEGLPVSLLEAQASGLPCLISDVVSPSAVCSKCVVKESLSSSPLEWVYDLEKILEKQALNDRFEAWRKVENNGFDIIKESDAFFRGLNELVIKGD